MNAYRFLVTMASIAIAMVWGVVMLNNQQTIYAQDFTPENTMTLFPDTPIPPTETTTPPPTPTRFPTQTPQPTLTPFPEEHQLLVYASDVDGQEMVSNVYLLNLTTGEHHLLIENIYANAPNLSPNREWIVFESAVWVGGELYLSAFELSNPYAQYGLPLTFEILDWLEFSSASPVWSPDGTEIAYHSNESGVYNLYIMDFQTMASVQVTDSPEADLYPSWSPDGTALVYQCTIGGGREICIIDRDGTNWRRLTANDRFDGLPSWSPDGAWIAFAAARDSNNDDLYLIDIDGNHLHRLTNRPNSMDTNPKWSRDGSQILFESNASGTYEVCILTLSTEEIVCVTEDDSVNNWSAHW